MLFLTQHINIIREEKVGENKKDVEVRFKFDPDGLSGGGEYGGYFGGTNIQVIEIATQQFILIITK